MFDATYFPSKQKRSFLLCTAATAAFAMSGTTAFAQAEAQNLADDDRNSQIQEIIVTAQRKTENIQKVGISIQAFSGETMKQLGIVSTTQLADFTPGITLSSAGGGTESHISVRGVTQSDYNDIVESPNSIYLDDAYMPFQGAQNFTMMDLQRVEVQKGPQGTLFGRNATGGLIQFISNKPSFDGYSGFVSLNAGVLDSPTAPLRTSIEAAVGGPISDKVAFRLAVMGFKQSPYVINRYPDQLVVGPPSGDGADLGAERMGSVRGILAFKPTETFSSELTGYLSRRRMSSGLFEGQSASPVIDENGVWVDTVLAAADETRLSNGPGGTDAGWDVLNTGVFVPGPPGRPVPGGDFFGFKETTPWVTSSSYAFDKAGWVDLEGVILKNNLEVSGNTELTTVSSYANLSKLQTSNGAAGPTANIFPTIANEAWSFSQEIRLSGDTGNVNWQAGVYYLHVTIDGNSALGIGLADPQISLSTLASQKTNSYSAFAQGEWSFTDKWKVILGGRYIKEKKRARVEQATFLRPEELYYPKKITTLATWERSGPFQTACRLRAVQAIHSGL